MIIVCVALIVISSVATFAFFSNRPSQITIDFATNNNADIVLTKSDLAIKPLEVNPSLVDGSYQPANTTNKSTNITINYKSLTTGVKNFSVSNIQYTQCKEKQKTHLSQTCQWKE